MKKNKSLLNEEFAIDDFFDEEYDNEDEYEVDNENDEATAEFIFLNEWRARLMSEYNPLELEAIKNELTQAFVDLENEIAENAKTLNENEQNYLKANNVAGLMKYKMSFTNTLNQTPLALLLQEAFSKKSVQAMIEPMAKVFANLDAGLLDEAEVERVFQAAKLTVSDFHYASQANFNPSADNYLDENDFVNDPLDAKMDLNQKQQFIKDLLVASLYMWANTRINGQDKMELNEHWLMDQNQIALNLITIDKLEQMRNQVRQKESLKNQGR